ncbi:NF038122 family metalloprotease [Bradyrhizobium sp. USDA 4486]
MRTSTNELLSDDPFYTVVGNSIQGSYIPATSDGSTGGGSTSGSVMSVTSGGITINLILDAAAQAAPASFKNGLQQAVAIIAANITDKITVNITIDYTGTGGGAAAGPDSGYYENYSWVRSQLVNNATADDTTFNSVPTGTSIQGQTNVAVWNAQLKLWGVLGANDTTTDDASANFATDIKPNLLVGVALHELTHAMGRVHYGSAPDVFDLFRFTSPGVRLFQGGATAPAAYFSLDGGATKLADYGQNSDPSDFLNSGVQGPNDPFNEYYTSTTIQGLTTIDLEQLDALGFHLAVNSPTTIESYGSTSLVQIGSNYYLNSAAGGSGPELMYHGSAVVTGQFSPWNLIGAEQTSTGYEIAFKQPGTSYFTIWNTDSLGNYLSNPTGIVLGTSSTLESLETSFHQDLNGDGVIGLPTATSTVIEAFGSTSLVQIGSNYYLNSAAGGSGPELMYHGSAVVTGQFSPWSLIGAEQTSTGYEIAFKQPGTSYFTIWNTDSLGNYLSNPTGIVLATSSTLESLETSFHQDLNGDGVIGLPTATSTVIEAFGSTSLVQIGSNYYLNSSAGGSGPELMYRGSAVITGQFSPWSLIGAEQTSTGYEIAFKQPGTSYFTIWNTDSLGNYLSNPTGIVLGTSSTLESLETSFHQDLNGDGVIGLPTATGTVIEAFGSASLVQVGNNYYLNPTAGGSGPELMYQGSAVASGQFSPWSLIGAEQTSTGYEIAFEQPGTNYFTIWNTDSAGNYLGNPTGIVLGTSSALENFEPSFHQDLNGDGVIGAPAGTAPAVLASSHNFNFGSLASAVVDGRDGANLIDVAQALAGGARHDALPLSISPAQGEHVIGDLFGIHVADWHWGDFIIR